MPKKFTPKAVLTTPTHSNISSSNLAPLTANDFDFSPFTDVLSRLKEAELSASATSIAIIMEHSAKTHQLQTV